MSFRVIRRRKFWLVFLIVLQMGGVVFQTPYGSALQILTFIMCVLELFKGFAYNKKIILYLWGFTLLIVLSALFTQTSFVKYLPILSRALLVSLTLLLFRCDLDIFKKYLVNVLWLFCYLGFVNYFLINFLPFLFLEYVSPDGYLVKTIGFVFNFLGDYYSSFKRNQALFWEPGVYQVLMNILLYIILIENKCDLKKAVLPILAILSTMSTTGFVIMLYIITVSFFKSDAKEIHIFKKWRIILLVVSLLIPIVYANVSNKVAGEGEVSTASRMYDYIMGVNVISNYPLFGIGLQPDIYMNMVESLDLGMYDDLNINFNRGNTNSIISVFMFFGLPIGFLFIYFLYHQKIFPNKRYYFVVIILSIMSEPLYNTSFLLVHLFSSACGKSQSP